MGGAALVGQDGRLLGIGSLLVQEMVEGESVQGNMIVPIDLLAPILDECSRWRPLIVRRGPGSACTPPKQTDSSQSVGSLPVDQPSAAACAWATLCWK
jgi:hypothetical protein